MINQLAPEITSNFGNKKEYITTSTKNSIKNQPNLLEISGPQVVFVCLPYGAVINNKTIKVMIPTAIQAQTRYENC